MVTQKQFEKPFLRKIYAKAKRKERERLEKKAWKKKATKARLKGRLAARQEPENRQFLQTFVLTAKQVKGKKVKRYTKRKKGKRKKRGATTTKLAYERPRYFF